MENQQYTQGLTSIICALVKQESVKTETVVSTVVPLFEDIEKDIKTWPSIVDTEKKKTILKELTEKFRTYTQIQTAVDERNIVLGISAIRMFKVAVSYGEIIRNMSM